MQINQKYKKELFELYFKEDYERVIELLIKIRTIDYEEYFTMIMDEELADELNRTLPLKDILDIIDYKLGSPTSNKVDYLFSWSKISSKIAYEKFYEELYPTLKFGKPITNGIINIFLKYVLPDYLENKNIGEVKRELLKIEGVVFAKVLENRDDNLIEIIRLYNDYDLINEAINVFNNNSHEFKDVNIWADLLRLSEKTEDADFIQQSIISIERYINWIENKKKINHLLPTIKHLMESIIQYYKNLHLTIITNDIEAGDNINYKVLNNKLNVLEKAIYSVDFDYCLGVVSDFFEENIIYDNEIISQWELIRQLVRETGVDYQNIEDLNEILDSLKERYISITLNKSVHQFETILKEKSLSENPFDVEYADSLLLKAINKETFCELKNFEDTIKFLRTGEWVWNSEVKRIENNRNLMDNSIDYTYLVAPHFKSVETFLHEKILSLALGDVITLFINNRKKEIQVKKDSTDFNRLTLGNYYNYIASKEGAKKLLKPEANSSFVKTYLKEWTNSTRNAKLHKHSIDNFYTAQKIRKATLEVLEFLVRDFK